MIVADSGESLVLTGTGDVLEPDDAVMGIGSGGVYALAAARALLDGPLGAEDITRKAMAIAAKICVYTNDEVVVETLDASTWCILSLLGLSGQSSTQGLIDIRDRGYWIPACAGMTPRNVMSRIISYS